jgi:hypothetical protein
MKIRDMKKKIGKRYMLKKYFPSIRRRSGIAALFIFILFPLFPASNTHDRISSADAGRIAVAASRELQNNYALLAVQWDAWAAGMQARSPLGDAPLKIAGSG